MRVVSSGLSGSICAGISKIPIIPNACWCTLRFPLLCILHFQTSQHLSHSRIWIPTDLSIWPTCYLSCTCEGSAIFKCSDWQPILGPQLMPICIWPGAFSCNLRKLLASGKSGLELCRLHEWCTMTSESYLYLPNICFNIGTDIYMWLIRSAVSNHNWISCTEEQNI